MRIIDLSDNPRIPIVMDLLRDLSKATDPTQVGAIFAPRFWRLRYTDYFIGVSVRGLGPGEYKITRQMDVAAFVAGGARELPASDPWSEWKTNPVRRGGFIGDVIATPDPKLIHHLNLRGDPVLGDVLAGMGSCSAVPHLDNGEALNWALTFRKDPQGFEQDEFEQGLLTSNLVGAMTRNLVAIRQVRTLNTKLRQQLEEVARVQRALLPARTPDVPGMKIATSYLTSNEAGGDYYDFLPIEGGRWGFLIADVSGHGASAATVMAMLHAILHAYPGPEQTPESILRFANQRLLAARIESSFVTAFFAVYDPASATLTYARAGHNPPLLKDGRTGELRPLDGAATVPLGLFEDFAPGVETVRLRPRDTLVLYTDGITEAFDAQRRMFGVEGLVRALTECSGDPDCVVETIHEALFAHTGGSRDRDDDQTLVVVQHTGPDA